MYTRQIPEALRLNCVFGSTIVNEQTTAIQNVRLWIYRCQRTNRRNTELSATQGAGATHRQQLPTSNAHDRALVTTVSVQVLAVRATSSCTLMQRMHASVGCESATFVDLDATNAELVYSNEK